MGQAIGQILPLAVGVALSPVPIIAVILVLVTERARSNGPMFVIGWLLGLAVIGAVVLLAVSPADTTSGGSPATWVNVLKLALGALLLLVAVKEWRRRPHGDDVPEPPKWMGAIDSFGPLKALGAGAALAAANPKNLLLAVAAATTIAQTEIAGGEQAVAYAVFALVGTVGVGAPVAIYFGLGDRSGDVLAHLKTWMGRNNAAIMAVLCLVIGAKLLGEALAGFTA